MLNRNGEILQNFYSLMQIVSCLEIQTEDVYKDIAEGVQEWFNTSNYSKEHPSVISVGVNPMVPGKLKVVGFNAKTYLFPNDRCAKGINT